MTHGIAIFLFDDCEELDWAGPWEVLAAWMQFWPDEVNVFTVAQSTDPIRCAKGMRVLPHHSLSDAPDFNVLVYPGGQGTRAHLERDDIKDWIRKARDNGTLMTSVCTGSLVYASAGLLQNRPATTHWGSLDLLASLDETVEVRCDDRFVDDGMVITSAGVSAGIDMALHLVARLQSVDRAKEVKRYIQYDPDPPV